jgi:glycosyltransferase involved in cell wall biosynthesis
VERDRLAGLMGQADIFVNPRPSMIPENRANFPSKLLEYLSWGRPVISTLTPGVPPSYRSILIPVEDEDAEGLATTIENTLALGSRELDRMGERIRDYVSENLLWSIQARRLRNWLEADIFQP